MTTDVRRLTAEDAELAQRLGFEAFGVPDPAPTEPARLDQPGRTAFGAFVDGRLVAKAVDRDFDSWFGGVRYRPPGSRGSRWPPRHADRVRSAR